MSQHSCTAELDGSGSTRSCQSCCFSSKLSKLEGPFAEWQSNGLPQRSIALLSQQDLRYDLAQAANPGFGGWMKGQAKFGVRELSMASLGLSESIMCR